MNISTNNVSSNDPIERLIFEQNLRIKQLFFDIDLDLMLVVLNNGKVLNVKISHYSKLKNKSIIDLYDYELEGGGVAVSWEKFDEDLSVKGFIKQAALEETLYHLAKVA